MFLRSIHSDNLVAEIMVATFALLVRTFLAVRAFTLQALAKYFVSLECRLFSHTVSQNNVIVSHAGQTKRATHAIYKSQSSGSAAAVSLLQNLPFAELFLAIF